MRAIPHTITEYASSADARGHRGWISAGDRVTVLVWDDDADLNAAAVAITDKLKAQDIRLSVAGGIYSAVANFTVTVNDFEDLLIRLTETQRLGQSGLPAFTWAVGVDHEVRAAGDGR